MSSPSARTRKRVALDVEILGAAELKELARKITMLGEKGLGREMGQALKRAATPVEKALRDEYDALPARGGYSGTFSRSARYRTSLRAAGRTASFRMLVFAEGAHQRRDIEKLEAGQLRHPVFGRSRSGRSGRRTSNPWAVTRVKGGYFRRGSDMAGPAAQREMVKVLDEFAEKLSS